MKAGTKPVQLADKLWQIDLMEQGLPCRTSAYVIWDEKPVLIETGSSKSHDILVKGLKDIGLSPKDLAYVIVTHVHLDHAGGAGQMMQTAENATLVVHPRGARHMIDPTRLWNGAAQVYGDDLPKLFGSMVPVPEERVLIRDDKQTLDIGSRTLTFYDSPGHAKHHFTILDSKLDALFAGDAVGIRYRTCFTGWDFEWVMPSTSPVDFDPAAIDHTMDRLEKLPFKTVYHAHFGPSPKEEAIAETRRCGHAFADLIDRLYTPDITVEAVADALRQWVRTDLERQGHTVPSDLSVLDIDMVLDAMGLIHYQSRRQQ
ncbi:MBL fold metallo-hydrolase [Alicyclobacillus sp. SO9]|uniref:MBL fold metallo-hydrolase n=1 Tax=Alicyclobacillus sp. SO9 TaxID=2665646 RepID=UPI0018E8C191|nr:MBL fold metallo-hydrolase [Alicyclobacillus sp. SO9]QQE80367.1 MBL fold metallo-hydrolase [Alicyclobacillus sp. SO9]